MADNELEEFAKLLVEQVRDAAIRSCDRRLRPDARSVTAQNWHKAMSAGSETLASILISDCVDEAVFYLLHAIDDGMIQLRFISHDGKEVELNESGELAGWYVGYEDGWIGRFSRERFVAPRSDNTDTE